MTVKGLVLRSLWMPPTNLNLPIPPSDVSKCARSNSAKRLTLPNIGKYLVVDAAGLEMADAILVKCDATGILRDGWVALKDHVSDTIAS